MTPKDFMTHAIELAVENVRSGRGGPFAAVLVKNGAVIACGTNLVVSSNDPTAHAEIVAIREACRRLGTFQLTGCEIYSSCEPCPMCMGAIYWARLSRIYFSATRTEASPNGFDDDYIYEQIALPPGQRAIPAIRLLPEEALRPFKQWKAKRDRIEY